MIAEKIANLPNRVRADRAGSRGRWLYWISLNGIRPAMPNSFGRYAWPIFQRIVDVFAEFMSYWRGSSHQMTAIGRIAQLKRDDLPFGIRLADGREFSVESGGSVGIEISANGSDSIIVFNAIENREYRIPVAAIARISTPENSDDQCT